MLVPKCCGSKMTIRMENSRFLEVQCETCGDTVFVKKEAVNAPQMLDD